MSAGQVRMIEKNDKGRIIGSNYLKARAAQLTSWDITWEKIADIIAMAWYTDLTLSPWLPDGYLTDLAYKLSL